jgi:hypothetical protein
VSISREFSLKPGMVISDKYLLQFSKPLCTLTLQFADDMLLAAEQLQIKT